MSFSASYGTFVADWIVWLEAISRESETRYRRGKAKS